MSIAASNPTSRRLTAAALQVLDIPFEPAVVTTGDVFDHLVDHVSRELSTAATVTATNRAEAPRLYVIPTVETRTHRRAKARARAAVLAGRVPGSATSLRAAEDDLARLGSELLELRKTVPKVAAPHLEDVQQILDRTRNALRLYRGRRRRLERSLRDPAQERTEVAARAARYEREFVRALRAAGDGKRAVPPAPAR